MPGDAGRCQLFWNGGFQVFAHIFRSAFQHPRSTVSFFFLLGPNQGSPPFPRLPPPHQPSTRHQTRLTSDAGGQCVQALLFVAIFFYSPRGIPRSPLWVRRFFHKQWCYHKQKNTHSQEWVQNWDCRPPHRTTFFWRQLSANHNLRRFSSLQMYSFWKPQRVRSSFSPTPSIFPCQRQHPCVYLSPKEWTKKAKIPACFPPITG